MEKKRDRALAGIETAEARLAEIDARFCDPEFYDGADPAEVALLESERDRLQTRMAERMQEWERLEADLAAPGAG
jgi:hypothetical protein